MWLEVGGGGANEKRVLKGDLTIDQKEREVEEETRRENTAKVKKMQE